MGRRWQPWQQRDSRGLRGGRPEELAVASKRRWQHQGRIVRQPLRPCGLVEGTNTWKFLIFFLFKAGAG